MGRLEFDADRYRKLLAEATDERRRLALIELLIEERARERLEGERSSERKCDHSDDPEGLDKSEA